MKEKNISLEHIKIIREGTPKKKENSDLRWVYELLGWEKNDRKTK